MLHPAAVDLGREAARRLALSGVCEIRPGLTDREFAQIEAEHGVEFANDHRAFLAAGLPINSARPEEGATWERPWPDWREGEDEELRFHLDCPVREVLGDVERGAWLGVARPWVKGDPLPMWGEFLP
ncbi:hypothetical protein [Nonomuraea zeae]|uniref:SMI1/KNR4 family protein n=1 Tax=Nonomuraea zeae TaxID=1642303 RepID=A0A5S4GTI9_9ACTN|nr:hypothetical protein [Nonomuraea zeae]TMR36233.1 hypothetical protein ETD85_11545 [Nonomuraea zeae]